MANKEFLVAQSLRPNAQSPNDYSFYANTIVRADFTYVSDWMFAGRGQLRKPG